MNKDSKENAQYVSFPETYTRRQLNALYREIPLKDTASRTLRKYFNAMANLYGVVSLQKAYEIISDQCPSLVSKKEFLAFAEIARHECEDYYILGEEEIYTDGEAGSPMDREIIDVLLMDSDIDAYIDTKQSQRGKPYYIPPKNQLLLYADSFYCEATPEATALRQFISEHLTLSQPMEEALLEGILCSARHVDTGLPEITDCLKDMEIDFESADAYEKFVSLYQAFHNTTRMQCNRGYTPNELFSMMPPQRRMPQAISLGPNIRAALASGAMNIDELRKSVLTADFPNEGLRFSLLKELSEIEKESKPKKKVGRNDPCPCGSGKKYKNCCGRGK